MAQPFRIISCFTHVAHRNAAALMNFFCLVQSPSARPVKLASGLSPISFRGNAAASSPAGYGLPSTRPCRARSGASVRPLTLVTIQKLLARFDPKLFRFDATRPSLELAVSK